MGGGNFDVQHRYSVPKLVRLTVCFYTLSPNPNSTVITMPHPFLTTPKILVEPYYALLLISVSFVVLLHYHNYKNIFLAFSWPWSVASCKVICVD